MRTDPVGQHQHMNRMALSLTGGNQTATAEALIVRMWREDQDRRMAHQTTKGYYGQRTHSLQQIASAHRTKKVTTQSPWDAQHVIPFFFAQKRSSKEL